MTTEAIVDHVDHFQHRVVQDAIADATATYWRRRAATFDWARPRSGDYLGSAGQERADELDARLVTARDACLARAVVSIIKEAA